MGTLDCGCVIADRSNTRAVRNGFEMGGYRKEICPIHEREGLMNTLKERLANKTQKVINALEELARLSSAGKDIEPEDIAKIDAAIESKLKRTMNALSTGRDEINFKL